MITTLSLTGKYYFFIIKNLSEIEGFRISRPKLTTSISRQIFADLQKNISISSKTTVYNTLWILVEDGLVKVITTEDNENRYDIKFENHGYFKCEFSGTIFNFNINVNSLTSRGLDNYQISDKNVYLKSICPRYF
jgi:Fe2+ or Zn2+ uptake regulation protein